MNCSFDVGSVFVIELVIFCTLFLLFLRVSSKSGVPVYLCIVAFCFYIATEFALLSLHVNKLN